MLTELVSEDLNIKLIKSLSRPKKKSNKEQFLKLHNPVTLHVTVGLGVVFGFRGNR